MTRRRSEVTKTIDPELHQHLLIQATWRGGEGHVVGKGDVTAASPPHLALSQAVWLSLSLSLFVFFFFYLRSVGDAPCLPRRSLLDKWALEGSDALCR